MVLKHSTPHIASYGHPYGKGHDLVWNDSEGVLSAVKLRKQVEPFRTHPYW